MDEYFLSTKFRQKSGVERTKKCSRSDDQEHFLCYFWVKTLLQTFLNSDSHGNGHADHGVGACAQEAHHLNVKSACRRLCACGAGTFGAGSPTFRKTRSTSPESSMLCFPSMGTSYHITCSRNKPLELNCTTSHQLSTAGNILEHLPIICLSTHKKLF